jgi:hypothetical protein
MRLARFAKGIAAEAASYNEGVARGGLSKPAPRIALFVGGAFRPDAFR